MAQNEAQKQKEAQIGRRQFNISPSEKLIDHFSCKYKSKLLSAGGSLWLFKAHFCYYSNLFGTEKKIRLRICEIAKITASGNSSIEIITTKKNETHKFVGFPSKDKRDSVVQFVINQQNISNKLNNYSLSPSYHAHSKSIESNHYSLIESTNPIDAYSRSKSHSISLSHSLSVDESRHKSDADILKKTAHIQTANIHSKPKPTPTTIPAPSKPIQSITLLNIDDKIISNISPNIAPTTTTTTVIGNGYHHNDDEGAAPNSDKDKDTEDMISSSMRKHHHSPLSPAKLLTRESYIAPSYIASGAAPMLQKQPSQQRRRRKSSGGINYNNPPECRLPSIYSQHSLMLVTPQVDDDQDDNKKNDNNHNKNDDDDDDQKINQLKRQLSNKDAGGAMDTLDIFNLDRSLSIHSVDIKNRHRSWSDSDMPHHDGTPKSNKNDTSNHEKHEKTKSSGGWLSIFHPKPKSHTKQNKKRSAASSSLGNIPKQPHKIIQARSVIISDPNNSHKNRNNIQVQRAQSVPEEKEAKSNDGSHPSSLDQYIDESHTNTPIDLGSFQNMKFAPLYIDDFWCKPAKLFHEAYSDGFIKKTHRGRGSTGLKIGEWTLDDDEKTAPNQPKTYMRKLEYISKIRDPPPFMPAKTEVYETQRFRFYGSNMVVVDLAISTPNIKYGDYFIIVNRLIYTLNEEDANKTHLDGSIGFKWVKKTWFEKIITSKATSEAEEGMALWASMLHEIFPPKISKQEILQKQISQKNMNGMISSPRSPRRRVINQKVIDYFHTPQKRKDIIIQDWIKPFGEILMDIFKAIFKPSSWTNFYQHLTKINDVEEHENLITIKHGLLGISLVIFIFFICNIFWMFIWIWYSSSLNGVIREQNKILQQQSQVFQQLLQVLKNNNNNINNINTTDCNI